jgi:hypothetical protein
MRRSARAPVRDEFLLLAPRLSEVGCHSIDLMSGIRRVSKEASVGTVPSALESSFSAKPQREWFYPSMAVFAMLFCIAAFGPSVAYTAARPGPLSGMLAVHGIIYFTWLLIFCAQAILVKAGKLALHRRLGTLSAIVAAVMVVQGYQTTIAMARRGFDVSGDLAIQSDPLAATAFPLLDIAMFAGLVVAAYLYRRRPAIHKRLMLLAIFGGLMPAPIAHLTGHFGFFRDKPILTPVIVGAFLAVSAIHDRIATRRIHPVSLWVALVLFALDNFCAAVVLPSAAWHLFASRLVR